MKTLFLFTLLGTLLTTHAQEATPQVEGEVESSEQEVFKKNLLTFGYILAELEDDEGDKISTKGCQEGEAQWLVNYEARVSKSCQRPHQWCVGSFIVQGASVVDESNISPFGRVTGKETPIFILLKYYQDFVVRSGRVECNRR